MATDGRMDRLCRLAGLVEDVHLSRIAAIEAGRAQVRARIADLTVRTPSGSAAGHLHDAEAEVRYRRWAAARIAALGSELAALDARHAEAAADAARAVGRRAVLERLAAAQARPRDEG
jgi:hypothetical protein